MTCRIEDGTEYPILWTRLGKSNFPISTGPSLLIPDKRFTLEHDQDTGSYSLTIRDITPSDAATYQCQVVVRMPQNIIGAKIIELSPFRSV